MAFKLCLSCKKQVGTKIKICSCGYDFIEKKLKNIKSTVVLEENPRLYYGQKTRTRIRTRIRGREKKKGTKAQGKSCHFPV